MALMSCPDERAGETNRCRDGDFEAQLTELQGHDPVHLELGLRGWRLCWTANFCRSEPGVVLGEECLQS